MSIRYIIQNKRGNYYQGVGTVRFTSNINKAACFSSKRIANGLLEESEKVIKVDVQITKI